MKRPKYWWLLASGTRRKRFQSIKRKLEGQEDAAQALPKVSVLYFTAVPGQPLALEQPMQPTIANEIAPPSQPLELFIELPWHTIRAQASFTKIQVENSRRRFEARNRFVNAPGPRIPKLHKRLKANSCEQPLHVASITHGEPASLAPWPPLALLKGDFRHILEILGAFKCFGRLHF
jgi:hypothetical protein